MIASPGFKIGTNLKINLDEEKDKPEVKSDKERKRDTKPEINLNKDVKPNIEFKQDFKKPDTNKITYEKEKVALILGTTAVFTVWWMFS